MFKQIKQLFSSIDQQDYDIEQHLTDKGFKVYSVSLGPVSSTYDCAIETFYQIKGGQVDYGVEHSKNYNLIQRP